MDKKQNSRRIPEGVYGVLVLFLVLGILIAVNAAVGALPESMIRRDMSGNSLYSLSSRTLDLLSGLKSDVSVAVLSQKEDADRTLVSVLERYAEASTHIDVDYVDPARNPTYASQAGYDSAASGGIIVKSGSRSRYVAPDTINVTAVDQNTNQYSTRFQGEQQLTSAIDFVTLETLPTVYLLTGHEEMSLPQAVRTVLESQNLELKDLNLLTDKAVPGDAAAVVIYAPQKDLAAEEAQEIIRYLHEGGKAVIVASYVERDMPQFGSILAEYGIALEPGLVLEGDASHFYGAPYSLLPDLGSHPIISQLSSSRPIVMLNYAVGMKTAAPRTSVTYTSLLKTTASSYAKVPVGGMVETVEKQPGDTPGPFDVGLAVTERISERTTGLMVFSSGFLLDEGVTGSYNVANAELFEGAVISLAGRSGSISIPGKVTDAELNTIPASDARLLFILWILVIPALFVVGGLAVWYWRRKR
ncbi:MAG: GldG family protein [Lachnospiraceae bacterium]|nr:GldG family protein [Lachnospiraceae bacterium]